MTQMKKRNFKKSPLPISYMEYSKYDFLEKLFVTTMISVDMAIVDLPEGHTLTFFVAMAKIKNETDKTVSADKPYMSFQMYNELPTSDRILIDSWEKRGLFQVGKKPEKNPIIAYPKIKVI